MAASHGNDLHRQREFAQNAHHLGFVGNTDKGLGDGSHNLFPGQGAAAALDQLQALVGLVGTVDIELDFVNGVQVIHRNAVFFQAFGGGFGARYGAVEIVFVLGQVIDEKVDRKSTRLNSSHVRISYAVFCLKKKTKNN